MNQCSRHKTSASLDRRRQASGLDEAWGDLDAGRQVEANQRSCEEAELRSRWFEMASTTPGMANATVGIARARQEMIGRGAGNGDVALNGRRPCPFLPFDRRLSRQAQHDHSAQKTCSSVWRVVALLVLATILETPARPSGCGHEVRRWWLLFNRAQAACLRER